MTGFFAALLLAQAAPIPDSMISMGTGNASCSEWTAHKIAGGPYREADKQWMLGFITGFEFAGRGMGMWPLVKADDIPEDLILLIDGYCGTHPDEDVAIAAQYLWLMLSNRAQKQEK